MNFLAHFHLARLTYTSRLGGYLGDFSKGSQLNEMPPSVRLGIRLHRRIDSFTDQHQDVIRAKSLLSSSRRRFAGIIIDVAFDHFLAKSWNDYSNQSLAEFTENTYQRLSSQQQLMPSDARRTFERMKRYNWLESYANPISIHRSIDAIANRLSRPTALYGAGQEFELHYAELERFFQRFYPELMHFSRHIATQLAEAEEDK